MTSDALIGRVLQGRYRIISLIERGGMGRVYLAEQQPLVRPVAVKILDLSDPRGEFSQRFMTEAAVQGNLTHPNTTRIFDYGRTEDGIYFIAMELLRGEPLRALIKREAPLDPLRVVRIGRQICGALAEAHALGLVHRDLKPGNIFITDHEGRNDHIKVLDFGLVKDTKTDLSLSTTGQALGSPMYMAPEQVEGNPVDARADVYSLGIVLWCALTGRKPYKNTTATRVLFDQLSTPIPRPSAVVSGLQIPAELEALVMSCVKKDRALRPSSMVRIDADLEEIENALRGDSISRTLSAQAPTSRAPMALGLVSVGLLASLVVLFLVAIGSGGAFLYVRGAESPIAEAPPEVFTRTVPLDACESVVFRAPHRDQLHGRVALVGEARVGIEGRAETADSIGVEIDGSTVTIRVADHTDPPVKVVVFCPGLKALDAGMSDLSVGKLSGDAFHLISDSGWVTLAGGELESLDVTILRSGDVDLGRVVLGALTVEQRGSGDLTGSGSVGTLKLVQRGSGRSELVDMEVMHANVHLVGSGDSQLTVRGSLEALTENSGDIEFAGNPKDVQSKAMQSGMIRPLR